MFRFIILLQCNRSFPTIENYSVHKQNGLCFNHKLNTNLKYFVFKFQTKYFPARIHWKQYKVKLFEIIYDKKMQFFVGRTVYDIITAESYNKKTNGYWKYECTNSIPATGDSFLFQFYFYIYNSRAKYLS